MEQIPASCATMPQEEGNSAKEKFDKDQASYAEATRQK